MKRFWMQLMAAAPALRPVIVATHHAAAASTAKPADDDGDDDDDAPAGTPAKPAAASAAKPAAGGAKMPASAMSADKMGLPPVSRTTIDVPELVLGSADNSFAVNKTDFVMRVGQSYRWKIASAGTLEYKFQASDFFRNVWFDQIVISDLEVHMAGPPAWLEYDSKGPIQIQFKTVRPGDFTWHIEGLEGSRAMGGTITVVP